MQISCLQENLARGLAIVGRAVATRTTLPITQNVLLSADESRLKLSATNLEIAITTWVGATVEETGSITVPARVLTELVSTLPEEPIKARTSEQPFALNLDCARFAGHLNGVSSDEFPPIPSVESGFVSKIDPQRLGEAISHVAFTAATDDSRPALSGVKVEITGEALTLAAADGFRLAVYETTLIEPCSEDASFIIPASALTEVQRLIGSQKEPIEFTITPSKSQALFRLNDIEIVTQLIQGTFPNYSQLIPESSEVRAIAKLDEFIQATRTASIFARDGSGIVRIELLNDEDSGAGKLSITSKAEEIGENQREIDATVEGGTAKIAFNNKYLSDVLGILNSSEISLEVTSPSSPGVIRPVGNDNYTHVIMPMFVQW